MLYSAGTHTTSLLTGVTKPSGNTEANVAYNPVLVRNSANRPDLG